MKIHFASKLKKHYKILLFGFLILASCKSLDLSKPGPVSSPPLASSTVNVPFEMPKNTLDRILNSQIPSRIIQEENLDFGSGMEGNLLLIRNGELSWNALDSQTVQIRLPLKLEGQVVLKRGGLGNIFRGKVPLNEEFAPVFRFNPEINSNWTISISEFELVDLGGNLSLEVLGLRLDLTGLMEKELRRWALENLNEDKALLNLKPFVEKAWNQAGRPFSVDWQGGRSAFSLQPEQVRFKEYFDTDDNFNVLLGLDGKINTHPIDAAPSRAFPLPNLSSNNDYGNHLEILLPLEVDYADLDQLLEQNLEGRNFRVNRKTNLSLGGIRTEAFGSLVLVSMDFLAKRSVGEDWKGKIYVVGRPEFDSQTQNVVFKDLNLKLDSDQSQARWGVALKKRKIIRQIQKQSKFPIRDLLADSEEGILERLGFETEVADLAISELEIVPDQFIPVSRGLLVYMKASGKVRVSWR
ncbi:DUF4403 family protein [Algoriphagus sp. CAU 1675]|uniref:DUF4403 family protein n=1 Tax=Algoriphagus sp. CAU 1675 TaxID=3032597 RepID=UPI0023D9E40E|nr:DUF4403 family protein [Algoriphagus sp. CAU 1675]MDF2156292.1 DUF4403 family protein [Algoriphagus sp. CAU 1675]